MNNGDIFRMKIAQKEPGTYEITIEGEDDTIGHLISTYLELSDEVQLSYYSRPHPLENKIIIYVKLKNLDADLRRTLDRVLNKILEDLNEFKSQYLAALQRSGASLE